MGMNARAQLCYGVPFPEDFDFPWEDGDPESWWREVHGYDNPHVVKWGSYDRDDPKVRLLIKAHFDFEKEWDKTHPPMPFDVVYHGYGGDGSTLAILIVPDTYLRVEWGETLDIPETLSPPVYRGRLLDFLEQYFPDYPALRPRWVLSAYYG